MVDLPSIPDRVPQVTAPQSRVSPGQIVQPYQELAGLSETVSGELNQVARPLAERAGLEAVTRNPDGSLQVERLPIVGPAAEDFRNAVHTSALAKSGAEARRKDLELAREFANDPEGYLKAADAFKTKYVNSITKSVDPAVGLKLGTIIDGTTTQQYNNLLAQQQATIRRNFDHDTAAVIRDAKVDLDNLIETGGMESDAGRKQAKQLLDRIVGTYHERVNNPVLSAPRGEAALAIKKLDQDIGGALFAAKVKKTLDDNPEDGVSKAEALIDENFNDTSIPASQRVTNRDRAQDALKTWTQDRTRAASIAAKQQQAKDALFEDAVIRSTAPGGPEITETDIKKADISPSAKIKMLGFLKREGMPEPLARVSHETSMDLLRQIRSGDMTTNGAIYDAYDAGKLSRTDFNFLNGELTNTRSPEGERLNKVKAQFFKSVQASITKSNPLQGTLDKTGDLELYRLEWDVNQRMNEYRQQGKNPYDLLDPSKPDFMGSPAALQPYQKSMQESQQNYIQRLFGRPPAAPAVGAPSAPAQPSARRPGETPDQYLRRMGIK